MNLNDIKIVNREYDLNNGFFWVEFEDGRYLQCCLAAEFCFERELDFKYLPQIDSNDTGYWDGLSRENNEWAKDDDGNVEHIKEFLIIQASKAELDII